MSIKRIVVATMLVLALATPNASAEFWFGVNDTVSLSIDSLKVTVKLDDGISANEVLDPINRIVAVVEDSNLIDGFIACSLSTGADYAAFLDSLDTLNGINLVEPYYLTLDGFPELVGDGMCVAFYETVSYQQIDSINALYNVVIDRERIGKAKSFTLKNTDSSGYRVVELSNIYHNLPETEYAHPDFSAAIVTNAYNLYDYYNQYQPHTKKVIGTFNSASVWDFAGLTLPIKVAVLDDGLTSHEDLPAARILPGYDYAGTVPTSPPDNNPTPGTGRAHGMATSGIIGSSHTTDAAGGLLTSSGLISLDPNVRIIPVKIFTDAGFGNNDLSRLTDAVDFAWTQGADVLSNSWGFTNPNVADRPDLNAAISRATVQGRGGKGCPVIFSSGNTSSTFPNPAIVRYPARLSFCFAVGAIQMNDIRWGYSCYGPQLDIVAPSSDGAIVPVWSLDQMLTLGVNPNLISSCPPGSNDVDYYCQFGGTSAACPVVAGIAALLISKDSGLSKDQIYTILDSSAVTSLDWGTITPPHLQYGWGRVDAFRAILSISRGDLNNDGTIGNILDLTFIVDIIFPQSYPVIYPFPSTLMADCNCDGTPYNILDLTHLIDYIYRGGPPPVNPCFKF